MARTPGAVTIVDVAKAAGVSKSTAARALAGYGAVSKKTQDKIERVARELGYRPNQLARSMITGNTETLGVLLPNPSNHFFSAALQGICASARRSGFEVLMSSTEGDAALERRSVEILTAKQVDGLIVAPISNTDNEHLARLADAGTRIVLLDRPAPQVHGASFVSVDHVGAARVAVEHLVELGHHRIGIVSGAEFDTGLVSVTQEGLRSLRPSTLRMAGYMQALDAAGLEISQEHAVCTPYSTAAAYLATQELLERNPSLTALFCTDDVLSAGAFAAIQNSNLDCPADISLVGFDDHEWATLVRPRLTVIEQPAHHLGAAAAEALIGAIGAADPVPVQRTLSARLIIRDSTASPRSRKRRWVWFDS